MADPSDLNRPYNSSVQVTSAWLNAVSDRLLNPTKTDWRQWSDADLDTSPGSLADRFAKYSDQLRVTVNVGRVVSISPGYVGLSDGSTLEIGAVATSTPASLTMPDDTTLKVFVTPSGVAYGSSVPVGALYLADVTTAGGYVIGVVDKRSLVSLMASANGAIEDRLDTLGAALGSVETSVDFSAANDGDIIRVGSSGGLIADIAASAVGLNADYLDGLPAALGEGRSGDAIILGTDNSLIFGAAPAESLGEYALNIPAWQPHETLVRSPSGDIRSAGGLRVEYGSAVSTYVYPDRRYAIAPPGSTSSVIFPKPSRIGEFIEITNFGSASSLTLDFSTFAAGTSTQNGVLGTMATEKFVAVGTSDTTQWFTFAEPNKTGSAASGGSSGGSSTITSSWSTIQSAWLAASSVTTGGQTVIPGISSFSPTPAITSALTIDSGTILGYSSSNNQLHRVPLNGGAATLIATLSSRTYAMGGLPDGKFVVGKNIYNPTDNSLTPIVNGQIPSTVYQSFGFENRIIFGSTSGIHDYDRSTNTATTVSLPMLAVAGLWQGIPWTDGTFLFLSGRQIYKYFPGTKSVSAVADQTGGLGVDGFLGISQAGRLLVAVQSGGYRVFSYASSLGSAINIGSHNGPNFNLSPLPDGRLLGHRESGSGFTFSYLISSDGTTYTPYGTAFVQDNFLPKGTQPLPNGDILFPAEILVRLDFAGVTAMPLAYLRSPLFNIAANR